MKLSSFWRGFVAYKEEKKKAFSLFGKGLEPPEVSEKLDIALRTCQRWFLEYRSFGASADAKKAALTPILAPSVPTDEHLKIRENWLESVLSLVDEQLLTHSKIRQKMQEILLAELDNPEMNMRKILGLSTAICKHSNIEARYAMVNLLDINTAVTRVLSDGYVVINPMNEETA